MALSLYCEIQISLDLPHVCNHEILAFLVDFYQSIDFMESAVHQQEFVVFTTQVIDLRLDHMFNLVFANQMALI